MVNLDLSFFKPYLNYIYGLGVVLFFFIVITIIYKKNKSGVKKRSINQHIHNWQYLGHMNIKDLPRIIKVCKKCGVYSHSPIYSEKKLKELEKASEHEIKMELKKLRKELKRLKKGGKHERFY